MNRRHKKKLVKRGNNWHYKQYRIFNEELRFIDNGDSYNSDVVYIRWNKKHTKIRKVLLFTNCYPSAVFTNGENTTAITDDYVIHSDLAKCGDIAVEQNIDVDTINQ